MAEQVFPTKGNLINTKKSLSLAKLGYELMDRKRNILIREMMTLIDTAKSKKLTQQHIRLYKEQILRLVSARRSRIPFLSKTA